jgi:hypothetical protein
LLACSRKQSVSLRPLRTATRFRSLLSSIVCLNTAVELVRLRVIPEQCRVGHPWRPGTRRSAPVRCERAKAKARRGGHISIRCLTDISAARRTEQRISTLHDLTSSRESYSADPDAATGQLQPSHRYELPPLDSAGGSTVRRATLRRRLASGDGRAGSCACARRLAARCSCHAHVHDRCTFA